MIVGEYDHLVSYPTKGFQSFQVSSPKFHCIFFFVMARNFANEKLISLSLDIFFPFHFAVISRNVKGQLLGLAFRTLSAASSLVQ